MKAPLDPARWQRVKDIFPAVVDLPPADRAAVLDAHCRGDDVLRREVESLLASDTPPGADAPIAHAVDAAIATAAAGVVPGQRVGPYRILREIGQGGMATVFLAVRDDDEFQQRVAIKVVRGALGADALKRFRAERQILASLEHPSIARLLDGGTTADGLPYLVMEYVDGEPISQYCEERQLTIRGRLLLFCRVCDAVSHAHRGLVVHRDLKPSNILVIEDVSTPLGAGVPKLLDFGIAKLIDEDAAAGASITQTGQRALTPEYASPEQVRGDPITTATDVYSLGVLLYELLTGERPLAFATRQSAEVERVVCTVEPRKPSTVAAPSRHAQQLVGDLDTIALTALQKEPARRYPSAAHLAEDIRRHLEGLPVVARPATWRYRSSRFVRRNRAGVAVAAVFVLVVVVFVAALGLQVRRVAQERDTADQVSNLLLELYSSYDPSESGGRMTAQEILDRGATRIQSELKDQPDVQARMLDAIGSLYIKIGLNDRAVDVLRTSLSLRRSMGGETLELARTLNQLASALATPRVLPDAEPLAREALGIRRRLAGSRAPETAESLNTLGVILFFRGYGIDGAPLIGEAIGIWRETKGPGSPEFISGLRNLALTWRERADYLKADQFERAELLKFERFERELLLNQRKALGDMHVLTGATFNSLGQILHFTGRDQEAEPLLREAIAVRRVAYGKGDRHVSVIESIHNLAAVLHDEGKLAETETLYRDTVRLFREVVGEHAQLAININNLATLFEDQRRFDEAEAGYREAITIRRQLLGSDHPGVARTLDNLARLLSVSGRAAEALPIADEALAIRRARLGDRDYETAVSMVTRARVLIALGRRAEAAPLLRAGHAIRVAALPKSDPRLREDAQLLTSLQ